MKCEFESHLPDQIIEQLFKHCKIENECLIWTGAITKTTGYGKIKHKYKTYDVHRLVGLIAFNAIYEQDIEICHSLECNSRACFRLKHLYKGNKSSNMKDSIIKGTFRGWNKHFRPI